MFFIKKKVLEVEIMEQAIIPVREGDKLEVRIESVGAKGDGIVKHKGYIIFVPNTKKGDFVEIRITKTYPKFAFAEKKQSSRSVAREFYGKDTETFGDDEEEDD